MTIYFKAILLPIFISTVFICSVPPKNSRNVFTQLALRECNSNIRTIPAATDHNNLSVKQVIKEIDGASANEKDKLCWKLLRFSHKGKLLRAVEATQTPKNYSRQTQDSIMALHKKLYPNSDLEAELTQENEFFELAKNLLNAGEDMTRDQINKVLALDFFVDHMDNDEKTLLCHAGSNSETATKLLLKKGANIEATNSSEYTPLYRAAWKGKYEVVQILLEKGAYIEATDNSGCTPLYRAAWKGNKEVVKILLEKGAYIEATSRSGETPLHKGVLYGNNELVKILLEKGANIEATDNSGRTPLHKAADYGNEEVVKILLESGANKEATNSCGCTPLHKAADYGNNELVKILLESGANKEATNSRGCTPYTIAYLGGHSEVVKTLKNHGPTTIKTRLRQAFIHTALCLCLPSS